jgi:DNA repair protein RadA/Sms
VSEFGYSYLCLECGTRWSQHYGQCATCGMWGSLVSRDDEQLVELEVRAPTPTITPALSIVTGSAIAQTIEVPARPRPASTSITAVEQAAITRTSSGCLELDRVLGGGFAEGSVVLLAGAPGCGKSTLLLAIAQVIDRPTLYVSAEETLGQIAMRGQRLGAMDPDLRLLHDSSVDQILATAQAEGARFLIVDSIQTVRDESLDQLPGSPLQVKACCLRLVDYAKRTGAIVVLVGHVTKDDRVAGPRTLDHLVDVVLYLDDVGGSVRHLSAPSKNRFGDTREVGVLEMTERGLISVSAAEPRAEAAPGVALFPAVFGGRAELVEIEALVGPTLADDRRGEVNVSGVDRARVLRVLAILAKHAELDLAHRDVYVSASGGYRLSDPHADLPIAVAIASSAGDRSAGAVALCGELALTGAVRGVAPGVALREAACAARGVPIRAYAHVGNAVRAIALRTIEHEFSGDECDCAVCGEGIGHYLHGVPSEFLAPLGGV